MSWPDSASKAMSSMKNLPDPLRDPADDLAFHQQRIDDGADVVDHAVAHDLDDAGFRLDLDLADVAAIGEIVDTEIKYRGGDEARLHPFRQLGRNGRGLGDLVDGDGLVGLRAREDAVGELGVVERNLQQVRGERVGLDQDLFGRQQEGRAADRGRARAAGAFAEKNLVGIALQICHLARIEAETVADDLLERGLVALALVDGAAQQGDGAGAIEPDLGALIARCGSPFDRVGQADTAQFAAPVRVRSPLLEAREVGELERHVHVLRERRRCHR